MRVLVLSNVFPPGFIGGYELGAWEICVSLLQRGHEVEVITSDYFLDDDRSLLPLDPKRILSCSGLQHTTKTRGGQNELSLYLDWGNIRKINSSINAFKPDKIIVFNIGGMGAFGILNFISAIGIPSLFYFMDNPFRDANHNLEELQQYEHRFGKSKFGKNCSIVSMSRALLKDISDLVSINGRPVHFIPGWVDTSLCGSKTAYQEDHSVKFVFSSRIAPHKGIDLILEAAANLRKMGNHLFSIDIYGSGEASRVLQVIKSRGLERCVHYKGSVTKNEMISKFGEYDFLLFPTWEREPFGFVVPEAAATGCVPIFTSKIGAGEWFVNEHDCYKIERSVQSLMDVIHKVTNTSRGQIDQMRDVARTEACLLFEKERWMTAIEEILTNADESIDNNIFSNNYSIMAAMMTIDSL